MHSTATLRLLEEWLAYLPLDRQPRHGVARRQVAPPAGLEPATSSLEVTCSVQLSYGGGDGNGTATTTTVTAIAASRCGVRPRRAFSGNSLPSNPRIVRGACERVWRVPGLARRLPRCVRGEQRHSERESQDSEGCRTP